MLSGFYMTLLIGPTVPTPAPPPVIDALRSVQVTTAVGQRSGFQLAFALGKSRSAMPTMLASGFFDPPARVIVAVLVRGTPAVLIDGVVTRHELALSSEPGQSTLSITGEDLTAVMDFEERRACYPSASVDTRVRQILLRYARYGIVPTVVPPLFSQTASLQEKIAVQAATDLNYIQELAGEAGYVFYIEPGPQPGASVGYWGPQVRAGQLQPALSVNMDAATNVESLSFSYDGLARTNYTVVIQEPKTRANLSVNVPDVGLLYPPLSARPPVALRSRPLPNTAKLDTARAALLGLSGNAESSDAISGSGQLDVLRYGHVLKARGLVGVRGAGLPYDGLYYVKSVTHTIKRGEYKQSFSLARDGLISSVPTVMV